MRWRVWFWFTVSVACFCGAFYFWRLGDRWAAEKAARVSAAKTNSMALPAAKTASHADVLPIHLLSRPGNLNYRPALVSAKTNAPSRAHYRLSNSTKTLRELARSDSAILLGNALIDTADSTPVPVPDFLRAHGEPGSYIVQSRGPLDDAFRAALKAAGATIVAYIPNNAYLVRGSETAVQQMQSNPQTQTVLPYEPYYKLKPALLGFALQQQPLPASVTLNLLLFADSRQDVLDQLQQMGTQVIAEDRSVFGPVVRVRPQADGLVALAGMAGVQEIEVARSRVPANDLSRVSAGISVDTQTDTNYLGLSGQGVTVAVADTGIDTSHPDLQGRVLSDRFVDTTDADGHGTHIAGIIAGDGTESGTVTNAVGSLNPGTNTQYRGKAPKANLFSMDFRRLDFYLQETASGTNALISNNSWVYGQSFDYDLAAASYDAAVRDSVPERTGSQPLVYVFPVGNGGGIDTIDTGANDDGTGGDADTVHSPGTAKNVITVGAIEQLRNVTNSAYICPGGVCVTNQPWQGSTDSSNQVANFSGRGNVGIGIEGDFGRFKPDLVAPGTFVVSTRSQHWNDTLYYSSTNLLVDTVPRLTIPANSGYSSILFIPDNAVSVSVSVANVVPPTNLTVYIFPDTGSSISGINSVSTGVGAGSTGSIWSYAVTNNTQTAVVVDLTTVIGSIGDNGNYFDELKTNLNAGLGPFYRYESGTSMAAADVSGVLALMEEFFTQRLHLTNSPALMKALLINGARSLADTYDFQVKNNINFQGWGQVYLPTTIPGALTNFAGSSSAPSSMLFFDQDPINALSTGRSQTRTFSVSPAVQGEPLRVTLVWTDPPGDPAASIKLVNDLDLVVTNLDNGDVFFGNDITAGHGFNAPWDTNQTPVLDFVNNVENVYLGPPLGTNYSVTVIGHRVNVNAVTANPNEVAQDYALVISAGDGDVSDALTLNPNFQNTFVTAPNVFVVTNSFPSDPENPVSGGLLQHQHVGANTPLLGTNTVQIQNDAGAVLTTGMTNQWHFYVLSNDFNYTNASFITFEPPELSVPRLGVTNVNNPDDATRVEADIDMYVSTDPGLTNLSPLALSNADKSITRGGTEFVVTSNAAKIYYVGIKSEDQVAAEYSFLGVFSLFPPTSTDTNGNRYMRGMPVPAFIPEGSPIKPQAATVIALDIFPTHIRRVIVTNTMTYSMPGNLLGNLSHNQKSAVLNNHSCITFNGDCITNTLDYVYEDNGENNVLTSRPSDGPGSLKDFIGQEGLGVWVLNMVNDFPGGTGEVNRLLIKLEPQNLGTNGAVYTIPPHSWVYDSIDVPADATNLTVCLSENTLNMELYVSRDSLPTQTDFDYHLTVVPPGACLPITIFDSPPLVAGQYFIGVYNPNDTSQTVRLRATIYRNPFAIASSIGGSSGPITIKDDAVTYAYLTNLFHLPISSMDVSLLINDPRISDLDITLISPNGTRILLFENRGALSTSGLGTFSLTTNSIGVPVFAVTNMTPFYTNNFDDVATGPYTPGALFDGWNVLSNRAVVYPELPAPWLSNNVLVLGNSAVANTLPTTNSTAYNLSFRVSHAPYLVGTVGWWPLDGDATDIYGGLDGLLFGDVAFDTGPGEVHQAIFGDGVATRMVVPRAPILDLGQRPAGFTVEGWVNPQGTFLVTTGATVMADGFENTPGTVLGLPTNSVIDGWLVTTGDVDLVNYSDPRFPALPDSGNQYLDINGFGPGAVATNLTLVTGRAYLLSLAYARNPASLKPPVSLPEAFVSLNGTNLMDLVPDYTNSPASLGWVKTSIVFTAISTNARLELFSATPGDAGVLFDSFKLQELFFTNSAVPLVEWADAANPAQPGVQFWLGGLPGTNSTPGTLWANVWDTNSQPHSLWNFVSFVQNARWQHVALTYDATANLARLYYNGHLALAQPLGTNIIPRTSADLYFGFHPDPGTNFVSYQGGLDEFTVYERPLTDCEIGAIAKAGTGGKYGTNVLTCPVVDTVQLVNGATTTTYTFTNGLTWTNFLTWETNTIDFAGQPGSNLTSIILSDFDPNTTVDEFILSAVLTNYIDGLMHFTDDTNVAQIPIKFAQAPYILSNFPPTLIFSNNFENARAGEYATAANFSGLKLDPARQWIVRGGPITVLSNSFVNAAGTNSVALGGGAVATQLPTIPGHRYKLNYSVRGPGAVSWWTGDINPLDQRAWDVLGGNDGAFIHNATNSANGIVESLGPTNTLFFPGWIDRSNNLASKIEVGDPENLHFTNSFTIEGWINPSVRNDFVPEDVEQLLFRGDSRDCKDPYWFGLERMAPDQLDLVFHIQDSSSSDCGIEFESAGQPIRAGQWQHVAAVFEASISQTNSTGPTNQLRLYINGKLLDVANGDAFEELGETLLINSDLTGRFPFGELNPGYSPGVALGNRSRADNSQPYYGYMDELSVYGRALTGPEIAAIAANGRLGKADYHVPPEFSLGEAAVLLDDVQLDIGNGENARWTPHSVTFTAIRTNSVLTLQSRLPGTIVGGVSLTELPSELSYQPEESLSALNGEDAYGTWTLEIVDNRAGGNTPIDPAQLLNWQLNFVLAPSNAPPVIQLVHGIPYTNTLTAHGIQNFIVNVPQWATNATNVLLFASDRALVTALPVATYWDTNVQSPTVTSPALLPFSSQAATTLTTNGLPESIVPGRPYYVTVMNPNNVAVTYAFGVWFDIISLTNCEPLSNFVWQAGVPRYFQFDVPTNAAPPGAPPQEVSFLLTGVASNYTGLGSNVTVVLSEHLPLPDLTHYDYIAHRPDTNNDVIMVVTNTTPFPIQTNRWYVGVFNNAFTNVPFIVQACYSSNYPVIIALTNDVPFVADITNQFVAPPGPPQWFFFSFPLTNNVGGVLFEMYNQSGDVDLVLQRDVPPGTPPYFDGSFQTGLAPEQIVLRPSTDLADIRGNWYLGIINNEARNVSYTLRAVTQTNGLLLSAQPFVLTITNLPPPHGLVLQWNSVIGEYYVVEHMDVGQSNWTAVHYIQATTPLTTDEVPAGGQYRVRQIAIGTIPVPRLTIQLWTNSTVRISWPATFQGILQFASNPAGPWTNLGLPVTVEGAENVVYDGIGDTQKYYRLIPGP